MYYFKQGLRGSSFEELINMTNEVYENKKLAIIQKIPTPITPVNFDKASKSITLAYFDQKSTVDYIGVVQGIPVAFDAKETAQKSLPLQNIHEHQIKFMENFVQQGGLAFILVHFSQYKEYYLLEFDRLKKAWDNAKAGERKSIPYDQFRKEMMVPIQGIYINYLEAIKKLIEEENAKI